MASRVLENRNDAIRKQMGQVAEQMRTEKDAATWDKLAQQYKVLKNALTANTEKLGALEQIKELPELHSWQAGAGAIAVKTQIDIERMTAIETVELARIHCVQLMDESKCAEINLVHEENLQRMVAVKNIAVQMYRSQSIDEIKAFIEQIREIREKSVEATKSSVALIEGHVQAKALPPPKPWWKIALESIFGEWAIFDAFQSGGLSAVMKYLFSTAETTKTDDFALPSDFAKSENAGATSVKHAIVQMKTALTSSVIEFQVAMENVYSQWEKLHLAKFAPWLLYFATSNVTSGIYSIVKFIGSAMSMRTHLMLSLAFTASVYGVALSPLALIGCGVATLHMNLVAIVPFCELARRMVGESGVNLWCAVTVISLAVPMIETLYKAREMMKQDKTAKPFAFYYNKAKQSSHLARDYLTLFNAMSSLLLAYTSVQAYAKVAEIPRFGDADLGIMSFARLVEYTKSFQAGFPVFSALMTSPFLSVLYTSHVAITSERPDVSGKNSVSYEYVTKEEMVNFGLFEPVAREAVTVLGAEGFYANTTDNVALARFLTENGIVVSQKEGLNAIHAFMQTWKAQGNELFPGISAVSGTFVAVEPVNETESAVIPVEPQQPSLTFTLLEAKSFYVNNKQVAASEYDRFAREIRGNEMVYFNDERAAIIAMAMGGRMLPAEGIRTVVVMPDGLKFHVYSKDLSDTVKEFQAFHRLLFKIAKTHAQSQDFLDEISTRVIHQYNGILPTRQFIKILQIASEQDFYRTTGLSIGITKVPVSLPSLTGWEWAIRRSVLKSGIARVIQRFTGTSEYIVNATSTTATTIATYHLVRYPLAKALVAVLGITYTPVATAIAVSMATRQFLQSLQLSSMDLDMERRKYLIAMELTGEYPDEDWVAYFASGKYDDLIAQDDKELEKLFGSPSTPPPTAQLAYDYMYETAKTIVERKGQEDEGFLGYIAMGQMTAAKCSFVRHSDRV